MTRRVAAAVAVAALAVLGACGDDAGRAAPAPPPASGGPVVTADPKGPAVAATVDGTAISGSDFRAELDALGATPSYLDVLDSQLASTGVATRAPGGGFDPGFQRSLLRRRIVFTLVEHALAKGPTPVTEACRAEAEARLPVDLAGGDAASGRAFLQAFPAAYRTQLQTWNAEVRQLQAMLSGVACGTSPADAQQKVGTAYAAWLDATLPTAAVTVDPAYGRWDAAAGTVVAA